DSDRERRHDDDGEAHGSLEGAKRVANVLQKVGHRGLDEGMTPVTQRMARRRLATAESRPRRSWRFAELSVAAGHGLAATRGAQMKSRWRRHVHASSCAPSSCEDDVRYRMSRSADGR